MSLLSTYNYLTRGYQASTMTIQLITYNHLITISDINYILSYCCNCISNNFTRIFHNIDEWQLLLSVLSSTTRDATHKC